MDEEDIAGQLAADKQKGRNAGAAAVMSVEESSQSAEGGAAQNVGKKLSAQVLQFSWENLLFTFGATIFIIDLLVFLKSVMPDMICDLGEEWIPENIAKADPEKAKIAAKKLALVEKMGCACVNCVVFTILMILIFLVAVIVNPGGALGDLF